MAVPPMGLNAFNISEKSVKRKKESTAQIFEDRFDLCFPSKPNFPWLQKASQTPTSRKQLASCQWKRLGGLVAAK